MAPSLGVFVAISEGLFSFLSPCVQSLGDGDRPTFENGLYLAYPA